MREVPEARLIFAASEGCADLLYLSGFMAPDPFLWLELGGEQLVVVSSLEVGRARKVCRDEVEVLSLGEARNRLKLGKSEGEVIAELIAGFCDNRKLTAVRVPADFPLGLAHKLAERGIKAVPVTDFVPQRCRKTPDEIAKVRQGVELAEAGLLRAYDVLRESSENTEDPGKLLWNGDVLTAERLRGEVDSEIARRGGTASHTIIAPGVQGADPHATGFGPIRMNEPIVMDIFPRVDATGYHGDLTRTVVKGKAADIVHQAFTAVQDARDQARAMICPGVELAEPHRLAAGMIEKAGFKTDASSKVPFGFFHGLGHGLGLEVHEQPRVSSRVEGVLEVGHVVTVEPGVYYPEWGGVRLEDVVAVTQDGCELLTSVPSFLEL